MIETDDRPLIRDCQSTETRHSDSTFVAESEIVFLLSRVEVGEQALARLRMLLTSSIDWSLVIRIADRHGVLPVFFAHAKKLCWSKIPPDGQRLFQLWAWENSLDNLRIAEELLLLVSELEIKGIPCVPYKGPLLSERLHNDLAMRAAGDLDILVSEETIDATIELLRSRGYQPCKWRGKQLSTEFFRAHKLKQYCYEYTFFSEQTGVQVDLHWKAFSDCFSSLSTAELLSNLTEWSFNGHKIKSFSDEHTLLILAAHASHHGWCGMCYTADFERFILSCPQLDWAKTLDLAKRTGTYRMLLLGLYLINAGSLPAIPERVKRLVAADRDSSCTRRRNHRTNSL